MILFSNIDDPNRILKGTLSVLRCFFFFDLCMLLSGIAMIVLAATSTVEQKTNFILSGGAMGCFASTSALVNCLASQAVKSREHVIGELDACFGKRFEADDYQTQAAVGSRIRLYRAEQEREEERHGSRAAPLHPPC